MLPKLCENVGAADVKAKRIATQASRGGRRVLGCIGELPGCMAEQGPAAPTRHTQCATGLAAAKLSIPVAQVPPRLAAMTALPL